MSGEALEEWKQDPNTGLWHLWRWNAAANQWEMIATQTQDPNSAFTSGTEQPVVSNPATLDTAPLAQAAATVPPSGAQTPALNTSMTSSAAKPKGRRWILIAISILAVLVILLGGGYLAYHALFKKEVKAPQPAASSSQKLKSESEAVKKPLTEIKKEDAKPREESNRVIPSSELTREYCTDYSDICFKYPDDATIEMSSDSGSAGGMESGYVVASDGTRLISFMDHYTGSLRCDGTATTKNIWSIPLRNAAGRPAAVTFSIMNYLGESSAELYVTNDPTLYSLDVNKPFDECIYYLVQPNSDRKTHRVSWFRVADPETLPDAGGARTQEELAQVITTPKYQQALEILKTVRNAD